jgi:hypothetical protein
MGDFGSFGFMVLVQVGPRQFFAAGTSAQASDPVTLLTREAGDLFQLFSPVVYARLEGGPGAGKPNLVAKRRLKSDRFCVGMPA